jgi:threonylcarbamoyladenosine tRNA methylthiotransferase MtaB
MIRRARRTSPGATIVATGCYAQLEPGRVAAIEGVDLVLGLREKFHLLDHLAAVEAHGCARILVAPVGDLEEFGPAFSSGVGPPDRTKFSVESVVRAGDRTRAFLKVQDGCDYTCSFCTIPLARGPARSQPIEACIEQARVLAGRGYREIVLTGVNVGDFGDTGADLLDLLRALETVPGLDRIRISSIEPNLLTDGIVDMVADSGVLCDHFHIPLQSGSDAVLRQMRRRYTSGDYRRLIERIKKRIPDCGIGVDAIVGFPGESEAHFGETYALLHELPVSYLHVFTYSERPNTPAAGFASPVPPGVRHERSSRLRILSEKKKNAFHASMLGRRVTVLLEGNVDRGLRFGLTEQYVRVGVPVGTAPENALIAVDLIRVEDGYCVGEPARHEAAA